MGLAERRAAEKFKTEQFADWRQQIEQAAGFPVPIEVSWDELAVDGYAQLYAEFFPKVYFRPLVRALAAITIDDMGKSALADRLTQIVVRNTGAHYGESGVTFAGGVLTVDQQAEVNVDYEDDRAKWLQNLLESRL